VNQDTRAVTPSGQSSCSGSLALTHQLSSTNPECGASPTGGEPPEKWPLDCPQWIAHRRGHFSGFCSCCHFAAQSAGQGADVVRFLALQGRTQALPYQFRNLFLRMGCGSYLWRGETITTL